MTYVPKLLGGLQASRQHAAEKSRSQLGELKKSGYVCQLKVSLLDDDIPTKHLFVAGPLL